MDHEAGTVNGYADPNFWREDSNLFAFKSLRFHVEKMRPLGDFSNIVHLESFLPCNLANPANPSFLVKFVKQ